MRLLRMLIRTIKDAFISIFRHGWLSFSAIISITVTLFLTSLLIIVSLNITKITNDVSSQGLQIILYLDKGTSEQRALEIQEKIKSFENVDGVIYKSEQQEFEEFISTFDDKTKELYLRYQDANPLSKTLQIKMMNPDEEAQLQKKIKDNFGIEIIDYTYNEDIAKKALPIFDSIRLGAYGLILSVAFVAIILISNTIRITIIARRTEIGIMRLVAASNWYIRTPFLLEGIIIGIIGGTIAAAISTGLYYYLVPKFQVEISQTILESLVPVQIVSIEVFKWSLSLGTIIGFVGSIFPVRKYLKK